MAACAAGIAFLTWIGLIDHSATCAFADVQEQVRKVRSVKYVETRLKDTEPEPRPPWSNRTRDYPRRHLVLGRYLHRTEVLDSDGQIESVNIFNAQTGKWLDLDPKAKRCQILANQVTLDSESGKRTETTIAAAPKADFYTEIRKIPAEATTRLPAKTIGDKEVVGFVWEQKIEKSNGTDTWKRTYWVNPVTNLPVRSRSFASQHRRTNGPVRLGPDGLRLRRRPGRVTVQHRAAGRVYRRDRDDHRNPATVALIRRTMNGIPLPAKSTEKESTVNSSMPRQPGFNADLSQVVAPLAR